MDGSLHPNGNHFSPIVHGISLKAYLPVYRVVLSIMQLCICAIKSVKRKYFLLIGHEANQKITAVLSVREVAYIYPLCVMAFKQALQFKDLFMTNFHEYIDIYVGLFLILCSLCIFIFPPKFGNEFYGIPTKLTVQNETVWAVGQKLFAASIIVIGVIYIIMGNLKLREEIPNFVKVILLIGLWNLAKYVVHKALKKNYPDI